MPLWGYILIIGFLVFDLFLVVLIFIKKHWQKKFQVKELQYIKSNWIRIIDMFNGNPKGSILDADKLLDYALSKKNFKGSLGDKLKKAGPRFSDLNGIWTAHKLRNKIAHELGEINLQEAKYALKQFKQALNDLGAQL